MQIKTVSYMEEKKFDEAVNELVKEGWKVDLSTYRTSAWSHSEGQSNMAAHGCYNSIILTKD